MFGLGIHYLMGWAMAATDGARKKRAEWPPHPDRVFMALAAAWFETGKNVQEGEVLRWLEGCGSPSIAASMCFTQRQVVTHYVPINDKTLSKSKTIAQKLQANKTNPDDLRGLGLSLLPEFRSRQPRSFPVAIPQNPVVYLIWNQEIPETHRSALTALCFKVVSVGHSASLVQMWFTDDPPTANLVPVAGIAQHRLRVFGKGRLSYLEERCNRDESIIFADLEHAVNNAKGKEKSRLKNLMAERFSGGRPTNLRPEPGLWQGYSQLDSTDQTKHPGSIFDPRLVILSFSSGKRLPLRATLKLTQALRGALLKACPEPIPEWVSGHDNLGRASKKPHIAILPLPFAGSEHADGRLMGVALALPRIIDPEEAGRVLEPWLRDKHGLPRRLKVFDGEWLECSLELETREAPPYNLQSQTWTRPARRWGSVTPVVLDRHFDGPSKWDLGAEAVKDSCERIGLPRPVEVLLHPVSMFPGVPRSNEFPWISRKKDGARMHHAHAVIVFDQKVQGPVMVGAGRFRGYGLCRPLRQRGEFHE